jgi:serine/threonine-protein kinase
MKTCPQCGESYEPQIKFCVRDGSVLEDAPQDLVGRQLDGQYEIESFVARGGMGSIYRARHIILGDRVAIKVLRAEFRANPEWLRRFQREGQAARRFRHPNAVTVYDLRTSADGLVYMVMEFVEGCSLDKELKERGRYTPASALEVLEPVARVLDRAHGEGVVHRDLKPENVMVEREADGAPNVKLLDLGIAKMREVADAESEGGSPLTVAGQVLGTPYYMSPEQWGETPRDGSSEIDGRADIYSLAVIFYELIAGRRPFDGRTLAELRHAHAALAPPRLDEVAPDVPAAFARAVERALSKDRGDRQPTAAAFIEELRAALSLPTPRGAEREDNAREDDEQTETPEAARAALETGEQHDAYETVATGSQAMHGTDETTRIAESARAAIDLAAPTVAKQDGSSRSASLADSQAEPQVSPRDSQPVSPQAAPSVASSGAQSAAPSVPSPVSSSVASSVAQPFASSASQNVAAVSPASRAGAVASRGAKRSRAPLVVLVVVILLVVCSGIMATGWFVWSRWQSSRSAMMGAPDATANASPEAKATSAPAKVEALSYWIEAFESADQKEGERVARAGAISLASGQQFKFHFSPDARGYFYDVGPGEGNAPTMFLTAQPAGVLKTNQAAAGSDFAYPYGVGQTLELDKNPGTEEYTVIYSATPLLAPRFLAERAGHTLTPAEQKELDDLRARAQTNATTLDVKDVGLTRAVAVNVPDRDAARLVVFDIRIEHQ